MIAAIAVDLNSHRRDSPCYTEYGCATTVLRPIFERGLHVTDSGTIIGAHLQGSAYSSSTGGPIETDTAQFRLDEDLKWQKWLEETSRDGTGGTWHVWRALSLTVAVRCVKVGSAKVHFPRRNLWGTVGCSECIHPCVGDFCICSHPLTSLTLVPFAGA